MNMTTTKQDLAKRILSTESEEVIHYIQAIFESQPEDWFNQLPTHIQDSVKRGLEQSKKKRVRPHEEVMKKYRK